MKWSYSVARVSGIDIKIHATFALILAYGAFQWGFPKGLEGASSLPGAMFGMGLMILLFACVVLHELGHSLVAQRFGLTVREIVLLPIGGVARLEKNPEKPLHELLIAAAGPLVNVAIAVLLFFVGGLAVNFGALDGGPLLQATDGAPFARHPLGLALHRERRPRPLQPHPRLPDGRRADPPRGPRPEDGLLPRHPDRDRRRPGHRLRLRPLRRPQREPPPRRRRLLRLHGGGAGAGRGAGAHRPDDPARRRRLQQARPDALARATT